MARADPGDPGDGARRHAPRRIVVRLRSEGDGEPSPFVVGGAEEDWRRPPEANTTRAIAEALVAEATGGRIVHRFWFVPGMQLWDVAAGEELDRCESAAELPWVKYAEVSSYGELAQQSPNDPAFVNGQQWALQRICVPEAWDVVTDISAYPIAVVDSGVNYLHPEVAGSILVNTGEEAPPGNGIDNDNNGYVDDYYGANVSAKRLMVQINGNCADLIDCEQSCEGDPQDGDTDFPVGQYHYAHGTWIAAIIGAQANNCRSIAGIGWNSAIIPICVRPRSHSVCNIPAVILDSDIPLAFEYALERGARIINCSWGFGPDSQHLVEAFKVLEDKGIVAVVAAGNTTCNIDGSSLPGNCRPYPALYGHLNMIVVGASDQSDKAWDGPVLGPTDWGSNYGAYSVDILAPGYLVRSLYYGDSISKCDAGIDDDNTVGTSFAAPLVSGVAAMVWSLNPSFTAADVVQHLRDTARFSGDLTGLCVSSGVLDAAAALGLTPCTP